MAIDEAIDQFVYLVTLRDKIIERGEDTPLDKISKVIKDTLKEIKNK